MNRLELMQTLQAMLTDQPVVTNLGTNTSDWHHVGHRPQNLYLWGGMGMTIDVGLGLAIAQPGRQVVVLDGDGSLLMGMGGLATVAKINPPNLLYICIDNERWLNTGGQATHTAGRTDLAAVARGAGLEQVVAVRDLEAFAAAARQALAKPGPWVIIAKVDGSKAMPGFKPDPIGVKYEFMAAIGTR